MEEEQLYCAICSHPVNDDDEICSTCGADLIEYEGQFPSEYKYKTLYRLLETIRIFAGIAAGVSFIGLIYGIYRFSIYIVISSLMDGFFALMAFFCIEIVRLFIDLEQNSRVQIRLLNRFLNKQVA